MDNLPVFLALAGRSVIIVGDGEAAAAKGRLVTAAGGDIVPESGDGVIAFVALDHEGEAIAAAARLRRRGLLVNVVDRPAISDFLMGAIIDRSPVVVAVSTGGATASLSRALRGRLEALLPASLGPMARAIGAARGAASAAHPTIADRRRLWERALAEGGGLDPLRPLADPDAAVAAAIAGSSAADAEVRTIVVTSADPGELTLNQLAALGRCDTLVVVGDVPAAVVDRARRDAVRVAAVPVPVDGLVVVLQASSSVSQ
ncbi:precorrin-2 dehydrogenase/sirohydrochlorin ferrochelatase family protein [Polymorphobacter fuscus]|uniref:precorrin-2 dehydrogenase n=1 Tax=Sandarakinorhabdus fusca TaxID=1439888 RepID=A0A7C9KW92_9SPHN|nr:siroheme synthase [Polymorphobacter fuscus]KAB7647543.1 siroheme synthase [Polymorphobacter fuscus]MQT16805.1 siroheme synthase [Polymorphobacter fuscus]NJC09206.1 uroporphyrin-III C-methyltransferase/precorrin-2 dehydrogenase/sirohydrochlorin ferrochelatase [Polymorphobacter fuscus]